MDRTVCLSVCHEIKIWQSSPPIINESRRTRRNSEIYPTPPPGLWEKKQAKVRSADRSMSKRDQGNSGAAEEQNSRRPGGYVTYSSSDLQFPWKQLCMWPLAQGDEQTQSQCVSCNTCFKIFRKAHSLSFSVRFSAPATIAKENTQSDIHAGPIQMCCSFLHPNTFLHSDLIPNPHWKPGTGRLLWEA